MDGSVGVVIPAAGSGERMGGERKQLRLLGGRPVWLQSLLRLLGVEGVTRAVVVVDPEIEERMRAALRSYRSASESTHEVEFVAGGATRRASVEAGVRALSRSNDAPEAGPRWVLVHDAVRPFVAPDRVRALIDTVRAHGAASLAVPVSDTLRHAHEATFGETVSRRDLYRMQTPQGAWRAWLLEAFEADVDGDGPVTDEVELLRRVGRTVRLVRGGARNIKITTPEDWEFATRLWEIQERQ